MKSFYFFDFETSGINPALDWPMQFAGIRTDENLNPIGESLNIFCKLPCDKIPDPEACLITGITPQFANNKGLIEPHFIASINKQLSQSNTCALGYNSLRFDDEIIRHSLYRNFLDPYAREWKNGNSRWDLLDLTRITAALRPEGIHWPRKENGIISFRLEDLTAANNLHHETAHDALSDVKATIALTKLLKEKQPKLYTFCLQNKSKQAVSQLLNIHSLKPVIHVSGMYAAERHCLAIVLPIMQHPINKNGIIVYDLSIDPEPLLDLPLEDIKTRLFTPTLDLPEGITRIPLKTVHINKCPIIAPIAVLKPSDEERLVIDLNLHRKHYKMIIKKFQILTKKLTPIFLEPHPSSQPTDPEAQLYTGGFIPEKDKILMEKITKSTPNNFANLNLPFEDKRLHALWLRYRGRHYPHTLTDKEKKQWHHFVMTTLLDDNHYFNIHKFTQKIMTLSQTNLTEKNKNILYHCQKYADKLINS